MDPHEYTWIFVMAMIFAFFDEYGIGANDVANSFATAVAANSLTLGQACVVASFTEFFGAFLMGASTSSTIAGNILKPEYFVDRQDLLMQGMMTAIGGSAAWVLTATKFGMPVSTTHSITGAVIGFGIAAYGFQTVVWGLDGVGKIVLSWIVSPVVAGVVAAVFYMSIRFAVLEHQDSFKRGLRTIPIWFFIAGTVNVFYFLYKGSPGSGLSSLTLGTALGISAGVGVCLALFGGICYSNWVRRRIIGKENLRWYHVFYSPLVGYKAQPTRSAVEEGGVDGGTFMDEVSKEKAAAKGSLLDGSYGTSSNVPVKRPGVMNRMKTMALSGTQKDVRHIGEKRLEDVHKNALQFDDDTENMFSLLQVLTACFSSFAHGSNDVANAVGPLSAVYQIWKEGSTDVSGKSHVPTWILAYGGICIDIGLVTYGYKIMSVMGNNVTLTTPSRGFAIQLAAAFTVVTCSRLGVPVSTTHCVTGAITAVGLCNGNLKAVNWKMISWCIFSWILTLPSAGLLTGLLFAALSHSPNI